jgi:hypothetical protein
MSGFSVLVKNSTKVDGKLVLHVTGKPEPQTTDFPPGMMYCWAVEADEAEVAANFGDGSTGPYKMNESTTLDTTVEDGKYVFKKELARPDASGS